MAMVASPSASATPPPSCPPPQFHVLAVDDSVLDRKLVEGLLRTSSYHVTAVDSVTKALEFLGLQEGGQAAAAPCCWSTSNYHQQQEINLIITDYWMPGMTGYDLLKTVKGSGSALRDIPVVIMSSEDVPARINRCLEEGADEFLLKPVKLSDMSKLRPHILRGKSSATKDSQEGTRGHSRGQELKEQVDMGRQQQPQPQLRTDQSSSSDGVVADADIAAIDSPRSNERKVAQGSWDSHLQDQKTRTSQIGYACL